MKKINWNSVSEPVGTLYEKGRMALSDAEVLSVIGQIDLNMARTILLQADNQLANLAKWTITNWMKFEGLGIVKASAIVASFELSRRRSFEQPQKKFKINSSADVWNFFKPMLMDETVEYFYILMLSRANQVIKATQISKGGTSGTVADPKLIFKHALDNLASAIVLVHNHPSGNLRPSEQDRRLTQRLKSVGTSLEIPVMDHLIFTNDGYFSFADEGLI